MEALGATRATPRNAADDAQYKVTKSTSTRAATFWRIACWANHRVLLDLSDSGAGAIVRELAAVGKTELLELLE